MAEANYSIKATIEANAKKFKSAIQAAKNSEERFKGTMEKIKDNESIIIRTKWGEGYYFSSNTKL